MLLVYEIVSLWEFLQGSAYCKCWAGLFHSYSDCAQRMAVFLDPVYCVKFWSGFASATPHGCMDIEGVSENWSE
jgi:hypothetical protein